MPSIFRKDGYRFSFFAADANEPIRVHVNKEKSKAKFWVDPFARLANDKGIQSHEIDGIARLIVEHHKTIVEAWRDYFKSRA